MYKKTFHTSYNASFKVVNLVIISYFSLKLQNVLKNLNHSTSYNNASNNVTFTFE